MSTIKERGQFCHLQAADGTIIASGIPVYANSAASAPSVLLYDGRTFVRVGLMPLRLNDPLSLIFKEVHPVRVIRFVPPEGDVA